MLQIPLNPVENQQFNVVLNNQPCNINLYQMDSGLYVDLYITNNPIVTGQLCLNNVIIGSNPYLGFDGGIFFTDTQGSGDPNFSGLGSRFVLLYVTAQELSSFQ